MSAKNVRLQKWPKQVKGALEELNKTIMVIEEGLRDIEHELEALTKSVSRIIQINGEYTLPQAIEDVKYYRAKIRFLEEDLCQHKSKHKAVDGSKRDQA